MVEAQTASVRVRCRACSPNETNLQNTGDTEDLDTLTIQILNDLNQKKRALISESQNNAHGHTDFNRKIRTESFFATVKSQKSKRSSQTKENCTELLDKASKKSDLTLEKLVDETKKDKVLKLVCQARDDEKPKILPPEYPKPENDQHRAEPRNLRRKNCGAQRTNPPNCPRRPRGSHKYGRTTRTVLLAKHEKRHSFHNKELHNLFQKWQEFTCDYTGLPKNKQANSERIGELVHIDFIGPLLTEKTKNLTSE